MIVTYVALLVARLHAKNDYNLNTLTAFIIQIILHELTDITLIRQCMFLLLPTDHLLFFL